MRLQQKIRKDQQVAEPVPTGSAVYRDEILAER